MGNNISYLTTVQAGLLAPLETLLGRDQVLQGLPAAALLN